MSSRFLERPMIDTDELEPSTENCMCPDTNSMNALATTANVPPGVRKCRRDKSARDHDIQRPTSLEGEINTNSRRHSWHAEAPLIALSHDEDLLNRRFAANPTVQMCRLSTESEFTASFRPDACPRYFYKAGTDQVTRKKIEQVHARLFVSYVYDYRDDYGTQTIHSHICRGGHGKSCCNSGTSGSRGECGAR